ncbi:hypothetical protein BASA83_010449 [Batrachochytrium salamandrivorans]|nr:hypothetical protein BASA83_010449 [Batrachochytrium salamandrivorans]
MAFLTKWLIAQQQFDTPTVIAQSQRILPHRPAYMSPRMGFVLREYLSNTLSLRLRKPSLFVEQQVVGLDKLLNAHLEHLQTSFRPTLMSANVSLVAWVDRVAIFLVNEKQWMHRAMHGEIVAEAYLTTYSQQSTSNEVGGTPSGVGRHVECRLVERSGYTHHRQLLSVDSSAKGLQQSDSTRNPGTSGRANVCTLLHFLGSQSYCD